MKFKRERERERFVICVVVWFWVGMIFDLDVQDFNLECAQIF